MISSPLPPGLLDYLRLLLIPTRSDWRLHRNKSENSDQFILHHMLVVRAPRSSKTVLINWRQLRRTDDNHCRSTCSPTSARENVSGTLQWGFLSRRQMTSSGGNCSIKTHPGRFCLHFGELRENRKRFALYLRRNSQIKYNLEENVSLKLCVSIENCFHKNIYWRWTEARGGELWQEGGVCFQWQSHGANTSDCWA